MKRLLVTPMPKGGWPRSRSRKTVCARGHDLTIDANCQPSALLRGYRWCRVCMNEKARSRSRTMLANVQALEARRDAGEGLTPDELAAITDYRAYKSGEAMVHYYKNRKDAIRRSVARRQRRRAWTASASLCAADRRTSTSPATRTATH